MKKLICVLLALVFVLAVTSCGEKKPEEPCSVASLKGPTTIGLVRLMEEHTDDGDYSFNIYGTADEITVGLTKGEIDIALIPCNLASVLYNKTEGAISVAAVNTLGVLYVVENGNSVNSVADLAGKTLYSTGKGTTPEFAVNYILNGNGLTDKVTVEYRSEATELAAMLTAGEGALAVLPQPYVATVLAKNKQLRIALDLTAEWNSIGGDGKLITGVLVVRKEFAEKNKAFFNAFLAEYEKSCKYATENVSEAAVLTEKYGIVGSAAIAEQAIPYCNITFIAGDEMQKEIGGYLGVLFAANPASVGGKLPDAEFYYKAK